MSSICRPFYLHNDFLPPSKDVDSNTGWKIFGYYDDFFCSEAIEIADVNNKKLDQLWRLQIEENGNLCGRYSYQTIFGFSDDSEKDDEFWKEKKNEEYPFVIFSMLQFTDTISEGCKLQPLRKKLEQNHSSDEIKVITYLSVDYSDVIIAIKCKEYYKGCDVIEKIHLYGFPGVADEDNNNLTNGNIAVSYGYSFAAIKMGFLQKGKSKTINGEVEDVQIYLIGKSLSGINDIFDKLLEKISESDANDYTEYVSSTSLLGCNDYKIEIKKLPWRVFLQFYSKEGLFCHDSEDYKKNLVGVTTIIGARVHKDANAHGSATDKPLAPELSGALIDKCRNLEFGKLSLGNGENLERYFVSVINSLGKFEVSPINDYLFQTVLTQINMIMDMASQTLSIMSNENKSDSLYTDELELQRVFCSSAYEFIKEFNLFVQNSVRSERQFTQAPDFDIRIYETPVKLIAFYNAYIYYMKEYLNTFAQNSHEYVFMAYPGVTDFVKLREKFRGISSTDRLFLMELPEIDTYRPRDLMIILSHEVAHNVGSDLRNRIERTKITRKLLAVAYAKYIRLSLMAYYETNPGIGISNIISDDNLWDKIVEKIEKKIRLPKNEAHKSDNTSCDRIMRQNHREYICEYFIQEISRLAQGNNMDVWEPITEAVYFYHLITSDEVARNKREELSVKIKGWESSFAGYEHTGRRYNIQGTLNLIFYLYQECIADLICIITHKISFFEYIKLIASELEHQGETDFGHINRFVMRIVLVFVTMLNGCDFCWKKKDIDEINVEMSGITDNILQLKVQVLEMLMECFGAEESNSCRQLCKIKNGYMLDSQSRMEIYESVPLEIALESSNILIPIAKYLRMCTSNLHNYSIGNNRQRDYYLNRVNTMLDIFSEKRGFGSISNIIMKMSGIVHKYYDEITKENQGKIQGNG